MHNCYKDVDMTSVYGGAVHRAVLFRTPAEEGSRVIRVAVATMMVGQHGQPHRHPDTRERYFVLRGVGELVLPDQVVRVEKGACVEVPQNTAHVLRAVGTAPLEYVAFHLASQDFAGEVEHVDVGPDAIPLFAGSL